MYYQFYCRGTKDFSIEMSMDLGSWMLVVEETLQDVKTFTACNRKVDEVFDLESPGYGRYLRFTAKTYYTPSAGLNYITWNYLI